jgi:hypothetical protein
MSGWGHSGRYRVIFSQRVRDNSLKDAVFVDELVILIVCCMSKMGKDI